MESIENYRKIAREAFGISYLRPYQELIIRHILEAEKEGTTSQILGCLPTGGGKSICFMLPALLLNKKTIIVYPLISLMKDQEKRFQDAGIPSITLKGGLEKEEKEKLLNSFLHENINVMITNPEMLLHLMDSRKLKAAIKCISLFVIDEAHTAITWGESFRPSFLRLKEIIEYLKPQHLAAYTATMDSRIENGIKSLIFSNQEPYEIHASANRENIFYHSVKSYSKLSDIIKILKDERNRPAIIFCNSRNLTIEIRNKLSSYFDIKAYHAGMAKEDRSKIEAWFMGSSKGVLSATIAFGMGINKKDIRTVIHLSIPNEAYDYLQESGRAGRDGKLSHSYVLHSPNETGRLKNIFKGNECIRSSLLKSMNETPEETMCLSCSNCTEDGYIQSGLVEILKIAKRRTLVSKNSINSLISNKTIWNRYHIPIWGYENTNNALKDLIENGYIKPIFNKLFTITRNGKKLLKEKIRR